MIKIWGIGIVSAIAALILGKTDGTYAKLAVLGGVICILVLPAGKLSSLISEVTDITVGTQVEKYAGTLLRAVGVVYGSEITGGICRSCGADEIAKGIGIVGRIELTVLSLPLMLELLTTAAELIK